MVITSSYVLHVIIIVINSVESMQYTYQLQYNSLRNKHYTSYMYTGLQKLLVRCGRTQARYSTTQCNKHVQQSTVRSREEVVQGSLLSSSRGLSPDCIGASVKG